MTSALNHKKGNGFYFFARGLLTVFCFLFYPCKLVNKEGANIKAPLMIIANHQSMMDPLLLAVKLRGHVIHFIGKRELTKIKPLKWIVEHLHMIAVSRHASDLTAMRAAGAVLRDGQVLGIFPEGRRRQGVPMEEMESGVSILALRHRVPLLPVYIHGRPRPFRRVTMTVLPAIDYGDLLEGGIDKAVADQLSKRIQDGYLEQHRKTIKIQSFGDK